MPRTARGRATATATARVLNCEPSPNQENDWQFTHAVDAGLLAAGGALPSTKDLRESWWQVGDQASTGSCVGWASAEGVLRWHFAGAGTLPKTARLSPRFIWMAAKETDTTQPTTMIETAGTYLKSALDVARKYGAIKDDLMPFASGQLYPGETKTFFALAAQLKIASYFNLGTTLANWRSWLATKGPILTRLGVDQTWDQATTTNGKLDTYLPNTVRGGHAVALVGYTADRLIVRNSWGTGWGDKGFAYASFAYAQAAFTEAYGVTV